MTPIRLFAGHDEREALGFAVFCHSVIARASRPVQITALAAMGMPVGSNAFTVSRFLVPYLCNWQGHAIFCDGADMLLEADIAELDALYDPRYAVQVVQHPAYKTGHPVKYRGTSMQCFNRDYERKNWASVMLMNCEHEAWARLNPKALADRAPLASLQFDGIADEHIGALPRRWNVLADEGQETEGAKLLHFTAGIPAFPLYRSTRGSREWWREHDQMIAALKA